MENFNVNDNTGYLVILRYFKKIPYRLDFSDTAQPYSTVEILINRGADVNSVNKVSCFM